VKTIHGMESTPRAGCSSGIEPLFAVSFLCEVLSGKKTLEVLEVHPLFEELATARGLDVGELTGRIARRGSLRELKEVPRDIRRLFPTAFEVTARQHLRIQAAFQRFTDNSVSKTINLPPDATVEEVRDIFLTAHRWKCKGIAVYRYGSKRNEVLSFASPQKDPRAPDGGAVTVSPEYAGGCVSGACPF